MILGLSVVYFILFFCVENTLFRVQSVGPT